MAWFLAVSAPVLVGAVFVASGWVHPAVLAYHLLCAAAIWRHRNRIWPLFRWDRSTARWTLGTSLLILSVLIVAPLAVDPTPYRAIYAQALFPVGSKKTLFALFAVYSLVAHAPLEEIFWRGVVTDWETSTLPVAMVGNAVFFGILHAVPLGIVLGLPGLLFSLPAAAAGALWAFVTIRSRSLWPALVSHWGADAAILGGMWFFFVR